MVLCLSRDCREVRELSVDGLNDLVLDRKRGSIPAVGEMFSLLQMFAIMFPIK